MDANLSEYEPVCFDSRLFCLPPVLGSNVSFHVYVDFDPSFDHVYKRSSYLHDALLSYFSQDGKWNQVVTVDGYSLRPDGSPVKYMSEYYTSRKAVLSDSINDNDDLFLEDRLKNMYLALPAFVRKKCQNGKYKDTFVKYSQLKLDFDGNS